MNAEFISECIDSAEKWCSRVTVDVMNIQGFSGTKTRHLYNNLCSFRKPDGSNTEYLEIGTFAGSTFVSALCRNVNAFGTGIDNFTEFSEGGYGDPGKDLYRNIATFLEPGQGIFIEGDCFSSEVLGHLRPDTYDIYLYDGCHEQESHERAITEIWPYLAKRAVVIVDDWSPEEAWQGVRRGTEAGFAKVGANIIDKFELGGGKMGDPRGYWNGCGIFVIEKP